MLENLFRKKSISKAIEQSDSKGNNLSRNLTAFNLIALGVGAVIGTGIFVVTGTVAALHVGPALTLSFVIAAAGCAFSGLCYAEFASTFPIAGSAYAYSYLSLGEFLAWFIGWDLILEYFVAVSFVAVGWSGYMSSLLDSMGLVVPTVLRSAPLIYTDTGWALSGTIINFPAVFIIAILASILLCGIKQSSAFNTIVVVIKVSVILLFVAAGVSHIDLANWVPYIPENTGKFGEFGFSGILRGAGIIFVAYIGFDAVSTVAQEAKNPQRDMPKGLLISLLICTLLYMSVTAVLTGIVHYSQLNVPAPIALAIDQVGTLTWLSPLIKIGAVCGLTSVILVMMLGQSRIFYAISDDGLLPKFFSGINKHKVPHRSILLTAIISGISAGLFPLDVLSELVSIGTLLAFTIVCISVIVLRKTQPQLNRPFKAPLFPFVPIMGAVICLVEMFSLPFSTWMRLIVWLLIGLVIYFSYGIKRSKLNK